MAFLKNIETTEEIGTVFYVYLFLCYY